MSRVAVVVPWREQPSRLFAYARLIEWYKHYFPDITVFSTNSYGDTFNLSQARNRGATKAIAEGAETIIFNDADTFVKPEQLRASIEHSQRTGEVVAPYTTVCQHKDQKQTARFFDEVYMQSGDFIDGFVVTRPVLDEKGVPNRMYPCSGVIAVPVHVYNELRGFDTRIKGWGPEDVAFHVNYLNKYRKLFTYLEGTSHSTYNDPSWRQPQGDNYRFVPPITAKGIN